MRRGKLHRRRGRRRRCDEKSGGNGSGTDQVAGSAVHVGAGQGCRALLSTTCSMLVLVMSEVLGRALRLVSAVRRDHRPDCLERHDEQQDNQQPAAHRTYSRSRSVASLKHRGEFGREHYRAVMLEASSGTTGAARRTVKSPSSTMNDPPSSGAEFARATSSSSLPASRSCRVR